MQTRVERESETARNVPQTRSASPTGTNRFQPVQSHAATLNRLTDGRASQAGNMLLHLQRQYGNRYVQRVVTQARSESIQRDDDDGGVSSLSTDAGTTLDSGKTPGTTNSGCQVKIFADKGCTPASQTNTCPLNQCCPAPGNHFAMAQADSTSSFKGSCSGAALETRKNDPDIPCNWFYKDGGSDFLFGTIVDCPVPIS